MTYCEAQTDPTIALPNLVGALLLVGSVIVAGSTSKDLHYPWMIYPFVWGATLSQII
jgi:hypothetical protein